MTRRVSKKHNHSIKIKAKGERFFSGIDITGENLLGAPCSTRNLAKGGRSPVRARGSRSQQWYAESRAQMLRKKCRTQSLWNLHLAGDWHVGSETMPLGASSHMMRVMLISNLAVDQVTFFALRPPHLCFTSGKSHMLSSGSPTVLRGACCSGTRPRTNRREGRCLHIVQTCWRGFARRGGHEVRTRGVGAMGG